MLRRKCKLLAKCMIIIFCTSLLSIMPQFKTFASVNAVPISNAGFEEVTNGKPGGWTPLIASNVYESSTGIVKDGTYSVKIVDSSSTGNAGLRSSQVPVTAGEMYQASVFSYNASGTSQLYLEFWNSAGERIGVSTETNSTTGKWTDNVFRSRHILHLCLQKRPCRDESELRNCCWNV